MGKRSWVCTVATQAALCLALYAAFNIGRPQTPKDNQRERRIGREPADLYFLSVRGGFRPPKQQTQLLRQMAKAAKTYDAKFVVSISELGEDDPVMQNATLQFPYLKIPWYTATSSHGNRMRNFYENIKIPYGTLDIIGVDTGSLLLNETENDQLRWLQRTLAVRDSNWRIVVGFDPLIECEDHAKRTPKFREPLSHIFMKYGVSVYLSQEGCAGYRYRVGSIMFIGNPSPFTSQNGNPYAISELNNGFLLHRVSPLEIESYFIGAAGKVVFKSLIHQPGRGVM